MGDMFFHHFALLVNAIFILNSDSISAEEFIQCEKSLQLFCSMVKGI